MITIPSNVIALLQSRSQIGQNRPTQQVTIRSRRPQDNTFESTSITVITGSPNPYLLRSCILPSGDLAFTWADANGHVYVGTASEADLLAGKGISNIQTVTTLTIVQPSTSGIYNGYPSSSIFMTNTGAVGLLLGQSGGNGPGMSAPLEYWEDTTGTATGTFTKQSTVTTFGSETSGPSFNGFLVLGQAYVKRRGYNAGNIVIPCSWPYAQSGGQWGVTMGFIMAKGDGTGWTLNCIKDSSGNPVAGPGGYVQVSCGSTAEDLTGTLMYSWTNAQDVEQFYTSSDGVNFTYQYNFSGNYRCGYWTDDINIYVATIGTSPGKLFYSSNPYDGSAWVNTNASVNLQGNPIADAPVLLPLPSGSSFIAMDNNAGIYGYKLQHNDVILTGVKSVQIQRNRSAAAGQVQITVDNKSGAWTPAKSGLLYPGYAVTVQQGYGPQTAQTFVGYVDYAEADTFPQELNIVARDKIYELLDNMITLPNGSHLIKFDGIPIETAIRQILGYAGLDPNKSVIQATGFTLSNAEYQMQSWGDVLNNFSDLAGMEWYVDGNEVFYFRDPSSKQPTQTDTVTLSGTTAVTLSQSVIVNGSATVTSSDGKTTYSSSDFTLDTSKHTIARTSSSAIPDGATVKVTYCYCAWTFQEGVDLMKAGLKYDRSQVYSKIIVTGTKNVTNSSTGKTTTVTNHATYTTPASIVSTYGIPANKILNVTEQGVTDQATLQAVANRLGNAMIVRRNFMQWTSIGIPWLQVGDCIRVKETSTDQPYTVWRILDFQSTQNDQGYTMICSGYAFGDTNAP